MLQPAALKPGKRDFLPLICWFTAPHVWNLVEFFYGHLIIFLIYFQAINVSVQMEEVWTPNQTYFQNKSELG